MIVAPTYRPFAVSDDVFDALRQAHARGCRMLSLCGGAFVLAEAGLLDGRRAATHWTECDELARRYPELSVDPGVLFVDEGNVLTGAGSAAGIDLCLHIVRQDYGSEVATRLARQLVVPPQRDGGQAQYIDTPLPSLDESDLLSEPVVWMQCHLDEQLSVEDLAAQAAMSPGPLPVAFRLRQGLHRIVGCKHNASSWPSDCSNPVTCPLKRWLQRVVSPRLETSESTSADWFTQIRRHIGKHSDIERQTFREPRLTRNTRRRTGMGAPLRRSYPGVNDPF